MDITTENKPLPPSQTMQSAEAVIVALASGRYAIVYRDGPQRIRSTDMLCRPVEHIRVGDDVFYRNATDRVLAIQPY